MSASRAPTGKSPKLSHAEKDSLWDTEAEWGGKHTASGSPVATVYRSHFADSFRGRK